MSESRAKKERKEQLPEVKGKKKNGGNILFNIIVILVIVIVVGVGGYATYGKIMETRAGEIQTIATLAEQKSMTADELLEKVGMTDKGFDKNTAAEDFVSQMTIENYAKFNDKEPEEFKAMYGIESIANDTLWQDAQMKIKMGKVAEVEFNLSFDEFALQNSLPKEITADMTQEEALEIMQSQQAQEQE